MVLNGRASTDGISAPLAVFPVMRRCTNALTLVAVLAPLIRTGIAFTRFLRIAPTSSFHCLRIPMFVPDIFPFRYRVRAVVLGISLASLVSAIHGLALQASVMLLDPQTTCIVIF